jgi:hypothetical protein
MVCNGFQSLRAKIVTIELSLNMTFNPRHVMYHKSFLLMNDVLKPTLLSKRENSIPSADQ